MTTTGETMAVNKQHSEFHTIDMGPEGWRLPDGYAPGALAEERILSGALDTVNKRGTRTRLLRFHPGFMTTQPFVHDYWEEVYLISGDLTVGNDAQGRGGEAFAGPTYAVRPPGVVHGPFKSDGGALLLEIHYYDPA
jgi:hypothetical protein